MLDVPSQYSTCIVGVCTHIHYVRNIICTYDIINMYVYACAEFSVLININTLLF